ncbi:hypothetical protein EI74_0827, partial [Mycoplasma testudineum]
MKKITVRERMESAKIAKSISKKNALLSPLFPCLLIQKYNTMPK